MGGWTKLIEFECKHCGNKVASTQPGQAYCDRECYHAARADVPRYSVEELTARRTNAFWAKVSCSGPDQCWMWTASVDLDGYGNYRGLTTRRAHQFAWWLQYGAIPAGMCVLHRCDTPGCCNVRHLFLGTQQENVADRTKKGRSSRRGAPRGALNGSKTHPERIVRGVQRASAKLTEDAVRAIRRRRGDGETLDSLAGEFGVSNPTIHSIVHHRKWTHVI